MTPADPVTVGGAIGLLVSVAVLAGVIPAQRATRIDPTVALHND